MKDGEIIQTGSPEELVVAPSDDYVAEFTRDIPRAKVLTVGSVMTAGDTSGETAGEVAASDRIAEIADRVEAAERPHAVLDGLGRRIGSIGRAAVVDVLIGRGGRS